MYKKSFLSLVFLVTACSPKNIATPMPTPTAPPLKTSVPEAEPEKGVEDPPMEKTGGEDYLLVAAFEWVDESTATEIMYSYKVPFTVKNNGDLVSIGETEGAGIGQAGVRVGECVESHLVTMTYNFEFIGRKLEASLDDMDVGVLLTSPDLVGSNSITVFDIALATPKITSFELGPFTSCMDGMDAEFAQTLLSFWLTIIPDLPPQYHLIPAQVGTFCTETISYIDEGLGELTPCYTISEP